MSSWPEQLDQTLTADERALLDGLGELLAELSLAALDEEACSATKDRVGLHVVLAHRRLGPIVEVDNMGEILVSYGDPGDRFAWENAESACLSTTDEEPLAVALGFLRRLLTGQVELHVIRRPWGTWTRSYWVKSDGSLELFLRGGTVWPYFRWQRQPDVRRFDFTGT